ncbi:WD repeat and SOCS box-containing protein 1-like [Mytilus galloprovincialis]|uniref:WD repeat and SOCS box-containing protein 1-like n=1 Tax=Mytilus galloprovincialis TaxID=29158 RepID=UPI003F7C9835
MRTTSSRPSGFQCIDSDDIKRLKQTDVQLHPLTLPITHRTTRSPSGAKTCAWSPDNTYFAWPCGGGKVELVPWDNRENKIVLNEDILLYEDAENVTLHLDGNLQHQDEQRPTRILDGVEVVWSVAFGSGSTKGDNTLTWKHLKVDEGLLLATGHQNGNIKVWDCNTGKLLLMLKDHKDIVKSLNFAPDGSLILLSGSRDGTIKFWDLNDDGNMYKSLRGNTKWVYDTKWSPKCDMIASVGSGKTVILWDLLNNYSPSHLHGHYHDVIGCCFSPDGALLATASFDTRVILWDVYTGQSLQELCHMYPPPRPIFAAGANEFYIRGISFHPHGQMVLTINDDGYVRCWDLEEDDNDPSYVVEQANALYCTFSPKGQRISVGDKDGTIRFYQTPPKVARLQHLSRMVVRNHVKSTKIDFLRLPCRIKEYLKYHNFTKTG